MISHKQHITQVGLPGQQWTTTIINHVHHLPVPEEVYASWPLETAHSETVLFCKTRWQHCRPQQTKKYTTADMHRPSITFTGWYTLWHWTLVFNFCFWYLLHTPHHTDQPVESSSWQVLVLAGCPYTWWWHTLAFLLYDTHTTINWYFLIYTLRDT